MRLVSIVTLVTLLNPGFGLAQQTLPSMNYWQLAGKLVMDSQYQYALEVSPSQIARIRAKRSEPQYNDLLIGKLNEIKEDHPGVQFSNLIPYAWTDLENEVLEAFGGILEPAQLKKMRAVAMQQRFTQGFSPFLDGEVASCCGLGSPIPAEIQRNAMEAQEKYSAQIDASRRRRALRVLKALPAEARPLVALYTGNALLPSVTAQRGIAFEDIPYPTMCKSIGSMSILLVAEDLQEKTGLKPEQLAELREIDREHSSRIQSYYVNQKNAGSFPEYFRSVASESYDKMQAVLSEQQKLCIAQHVACNMFLSDYKSWFLDPGIVKFLELSETQRKEMLAEAKEQQKQLETEMTELNHEIFNSLLLKLNSEPRRKMQEMFQEVWSPR